MPTSPLLRRLRKALRAAADPGRAAAMQAYMKSEMPYWGIGAPELRTLCREVFASYPFESAELWREDVLSIWRNAQYREERYGAIALSGHRNAKTFQTLDTLPMYEEMIVSGAWWDYVDVLASHRLGSLLARHPRQMGRRLRAWSRSRNLWKRRSAILSQLRFGASTDTQLLYDCIAPSLSSREFFLRKAIGWALRQLAWYEPREVVRYVAEHAAELSALSRREALKNVPAAAGRGAPRRLVPRPRSDRRNAPRE